MATTQYIGARYVPLFADPYEWDDAREYEPLTVVYSNGNSYTSKQYVPTGTPLTDENYWVITGNYNAQVEQYRKETKAVSDKYDTIAKNANDALSLAQTNEQDIASNDAELAGTAESGLKTLITNETERAKVAEGTISQNLDTISGNVNTLTQTVNEQSESISNNTTANTKHESQLEGTLDSGLRTLINSKFPIKSDSVGDGAITAPKLATNAVSSILQGFTVRRFNNTDRNADNTGMVCPTGGQLAGFYIVELGILVINQFVGTEGQGGSTVFTLPSYVPAVNGIVQLSGCGLMGYSSSNDFLAWTGLRYGNGRHIFGNSDMRKQFVNIGSPMAYLKPYETSTQSASYSNATENNQII